MRDKVSLRDRLFEVRRARTPAQRHEAYRLRHQVYCHDAGYFDADLFKDGEESDGFDDHSVQSLVYYRPTSVAVGTVRLILPQAELDGTGSFPFDHVCDSAPLYEQKLLPFASTAEVSRFCLVRALRDEIARTPPELLGEGLNPSTLGAAITRQAKLTLMQAVVSMTADEGITHWCAVMQASLLESFAEMGIQFRHFGDPVSYHGLRQPCYGPVEEILRAVPGLCPEVWDAMTDGGRIRL